MRNSFEYYKQLLIEIAKNHNAGASSDVIDIAFASPEERAKLALFTLKELSNCEESLKSIGLNSSSLSIFNALLIPLTSYNNFSREDFEYIVNNGSLLVVKNTVVNRSFPLNLLVDNELYLKHKESPNLFLLDEELRRIRFNKSKAILQYFRNEIPDSEYMSDEMVLKIAGFGEIWSHMQIMKMIRLNTSIRLNPFNLSI